MLERFRARRRLRLRDQTMASAPHAGSGGGLSAEEYGRWMKDAGFQQLREILFWCWDPIGVNDAFPTAADEYDSYAPELLSMLRRTVTPEEIASYLDRIERNEMGLSGPDGARRREVAQRIADWFEESISVWLDSQR